MKYEGLAMLNILIYFRTVLLASLKKLKGFFILQHWSLFVNLCHDVERNFVCKHNIQRHTNGLTWLCRYCTVFKGRVKMLVCVIVAGPGADLLLEAIVDWLRWGGGSSCVPRNTVMEHMTFLLQGSLGVSEYYWQYNSFAWPPAWHHSNAAL